MSSTTSKISRVAEDFASSLEKLDTAEDVADEYGLAITTVRKWTRLRILPAIKIGNKFIRYDRGAVRKALAKYQVPELDPVREKEAAT